jgi:hypothetical protein
VADADPTERALNWAFWISDNSANLPGPAAYFITNENTGLGGFGLPGWRRKRKVQAAA